MGDANIDAAAAGNYLANRSWPGGLQQLLIENSQHFPSRYIIVDDSGSMTTQDGHRILQTPTGPRRITCSRWLELTESLLFHGQLANVAMARTEFRLLNKRNPIILGTTTGNRFGDLERSLDKAPTGGTPLCECLRGVIASIQQQQEDLEARGQRVVVMIATDGVPSDGDLLQAMRPLERLPVWVVLRLCTDDEEIVNMWNGIDEQLEAPIDILDDFHGEAQEVKKHNPWLTYGEPLHRTREWGVRMQEFDFLDERLLSKNELRRFCEILLSNGTDRLPDPQADWDAFEDALQRRLRNEINTMNIDTMREAPWIDLRKLRQCYQGGGELSSSNAFVLILALIVVLVAVMMTSP